VIARCFGFAALALLWAAASAEAAGPQRIQVGPPDRPWEIRLSGEYRIGASFRPTDLLLDADGMSLGQAFVLDNRLRARLELAGQNHSLSTEWDLFSGQVFGDTWDIPRSEDERLRHRLDAALSREGFVPRRAALTVTRPAMDVELGLVTSHWGLGVVANDGAQDPLFGRTDLGDRVVRLRVRGRPLYLERDEHPRRDDLSIVAAVDWVIADDSARFRGERQVLEPERQFAMQGVLALLYAVPQEAAAGVYLVYRDQTELTSNRRTRAAVGDLFGSIAIPLADPDWILSLAAEAAGIVGHSDRATTYASPRGLDLRSAGASAQVSLSGLEQRWTVHLRGAIASGDANPEDDKNTEFRFDRNFEVGLLLLDDYLAGIEGATFTKLTDPSNPPPPDGVEAINTEGALRAAAFVQPAIEGRPLDWLTLRAGVAACWSVVDFTSPYYSFRAGGEARTHLDQEPTGRYLGTEINWSAALVRSVQPGSGGGTMAAELVAQGAHLITGQALRGETQAGGRGPRSAPNVASAFLITARLRF
jgi:hypothetical protein